MTGQGLINLIPKTVFTAYSSHLLRTMGEKSFPTNDAAALSPLGKNQLSF
jgi:hypothetical protein